jgi:hypothetical protein
MPILDRSKVLRKTYMVGLRLRQALKYKPYLG